MGPKSSQTLKRSSEVKNKRKEKNERRPNPGVMCRKNKRKERLKVRECEVKPNSNVLDVWPTTNNK